MKLKKVLACALLGITMATSVNVANAYAANGDTHIRDLGHYYGVSVIWENNEVLINDFYSYSTDSICNIVVNGRCMTFKDSFHHILHDKRIDHKNCDFDK